MPCPSPAELLNLWERAYGLSPARRAIEIVRTGSPNFAWSEIAHWPIGYRDRHVARLRVALFGDQVPSITNCPGCQTPVEFDVPLHQCFHLQLATFEQVAASPLSASQPSLRPMTTADVIEHLETSSHEEQLIRRCLGWEGNISLAEDEISHLSNQLEKLDPEARIEFSLQCPACGQSWSSLFDIVSVFWTELNAWARRMMQEIHLLATRYGWSEEDILRISPWRRAIYLSLAGTR